jgi:hypothetical protein
MRDVRSKGRAGNTNKALARSCAGWSGLDSQDTYVFEGRVTSGGSHITEGLGLVRISVIVNTQIGPT